MLEHGLLFALATLGGGAIATLVGGLWYPRLRYLLPVSLLAIGVAYFFNVAEAGPAASHAHGLLRHDAWSTFGASLILLTTAGALILGLRSDEIRPERRPEYCCLVLVFAVGLWVMVSAQNLLSLYLGVELVSLLGYTLAGFHREERSSVEASLKYVVYGSIASGTMLFGLSLLYGQTGSLDFAQMRIALGALGENSQTIVATPALLCGAVLTLAGFAYKVSAVPFHMWTPDVFEGAPTPVTALFAVGPKIAGFLLAMRFLITVISHPVMPSMVPPDLAFAPMAGFDWPRVMYASAILSMFAGNLAAMRQESVKRTLAYAGIAHTGFILMAASTQTQEGLVAILFYLLVYAVMSLGAFAVCAKVHDSFGFESLASFRGLAQRKPFYAVVMTIFLLSLVGLPPFAGFLAKYYVLSAVIARGFFGLAALGVLNTVLSLYFYIKIAKAMFLEDPEVRMPPGKTAFDSRSTVVFLLLLAIPNVVLIFYWEPVIELARGAASLVLSSAK